MTRWGCIEDDMARIAEFIERIVIKKEKNVKDDIIRFLEKRKMAYCF